MLIVIIALFKLLPKIGTLFGRSEGKGKLDGIMIFVLNLEENPLEHVQKHFSTKFSKDVEGLDQTQGATSRALAATPRLADQGVFSGGSKAGQRV